VPVPHPEDLTVRPQDLEFGRLFESIRDAVIVAEAGKAGFVPTRRPEPTTEPRPVLACGAALATRFSEQAV